MSTRRVSVASSYHPRYVVWELTLRCDQSCNHCGSRAGDARDTELSLEEALGVVQELKEMQTKDVVLIGGEAYLHPGFLEIVKALKASGIRPMMTTGGVGITEELAQSMKDAGMAQVSVSVDGLERSHDLIRGKKGSFQAALRALDAMRAVGLPTGANTNINRVNRDDLDALFALLKDKGINAWQVQITVPLGRAADRPQMLLQPYDLMELMPKVAALKRSAYTQGITVMPGNNYGYFGPEEGLMRSLHEGGNDHWHGCMAGRFVMGIESDGAVKGCPSLQTKDYVGGKLGEQPLREIWETSPQVGFTRTRTKEDLWGFCRTCPFAETCMAGCSFTAHALFGRTGNNPYCHFRARTLAKQGKRERLIAKEMASGDPFDHGLFEIVVEDIDATEPAFTQHFSAETRFGVHVKEYPETPEGKHKRLAQLVRKLAKQRKTPCSSCPSQM
ncbi:MAG: heme biosynthesis protein [Deltaproteobacteria bacterium]|nr:heme biosynthesis protein [Deltaproteobacteria bacterium]